MSATSAATLVGGGVLHSSVLLPNITYIISAQKIT